jgi:hypothetical protein
MHTPRFIGIQETLYNLNVSDYILVIFKLPICSEMWSWAAKQGDLDYVRYTTYSETVSSGKGIVIVVLLCNYVSNQIPE